MRTNKTVLAVLFSCAIAPAWADMAGMDHMSGSAMPAAGKAQNLPQSEGVVRKIDQASNRITIRHGELYNLGMPPMTMTFGIKNKAMLKGVKVGDKVRFMAEQSEDDGSLVVTKLSRMP